MRVSTRAAAERPENRRARTSFFATRSCTICRVSLNAVRQFMRQDFSEPVREEPGRVTHFWKHLSIMICHGANGDNGSTW